MAASISSVTSTAPPQVKPITSQPPKAVKRDADGDNDGTKSGQVDKPATSGSVGTVVNTKA